jgi:hypothetical protein
MKRLIAAMIIVCLAAGTANCENSWLQKFTRKKKNVKKTPKIYQLQRYPQKPSPELYKKHYSYVITWMSEIVSDLGQNHKKDVRCIEEIVMNMKTMQNILVPEWQEKFQPHVDKVMKIRETIVYENLSKFNADYVKNGLERENRAIKRDFCYTKVRDHLRANLEEGAATEPAANDESKTQSAGQ